ncbi:MAG TPA: ABC transporter permease [Thermoanaerobaculia bacterium]|nr:ABC transporter permease [Thermoanaerobaculia bacterium]
MSDQKESVTRISGGSRRVRDELHELSEFREVLWFLAWRDIKVRYRQAKLGVYWVILQPLVLVAVYTAIFSTFVKLPGANYPYAIFVLVGLLPWTFFSSAVLDASSSLYINAPLIGKVYFPRLFIPASRIITIMLDFVVMSILLFVMIVLFHVQVTAWLALLPILTVITFVLTSGIGLGLSALTARYWDIRYVTPFLFQVWMFCTPVIYPLSAIPARYRWFIELNPLTGVVKGFRTAFLGEAADLAQLGYSAAWALAALALGIFYFYRTERDLVEIM